MEARMKIACDHTIAMALLKGADLWRYGPLWTDLANQQSRGNDQYPKDLTAAYRMLVNYLAPTRVRQGNANGNQASAPSTPELGGVSQVPASIGQHTFVQLTNTSSTFVSSANDWPILVPLGFPVQT
jgi:hypothetical protein